MLPKRLIYQSDLASVPENRTMSLPSHSGLYCNERTCKTCCDEEVEKMSGNLANALCLHGDGEQKWGSW